MATLTAESLETRRKKLMTDLINYGESLAKGHVSVTAHRKFPREDQRHFRVETMESLLKFGVRCVLVGAESLTYGEARNNPNKKDSMAKYLLGEMDRHLIVLEKEYAESISKKANDARDARIEKQKRDMEILENEVNAKEEMAALAERGLAAQARAFKALEDSNALNDSLKREKDRKAKLIASFNAEDQSRRDAGGALALTIIGILGLILIILSIN